MQTNITSNIDEVLAKVQAFERRGEQLAPFFNSVANLLLNTTEEAFANETSAIDGTPWEPLSSSTLANKKGKALYEKGKCKIHLLHLVTTAKRPLVLMPPHRDMLTLRCISSARLTVK